MLLYLHYLVSIYFWIFTPRPPTTTAIDLKDSISFLPMRQDHWFRQIFRINRTELIHLGLAMSLEWKQYSEFSLVLLE